MADIQQFNEISFYCKKINSFIEDCAHAIGTFHKGKHAGSYGTEVFLLPNKQITTGEGGMIITKDKNFYKKLKVLKLLVLIKI